jgi:UvrD-like helicase C-terminal domain
MSARADDETDGLEELLSAAREASATDRIDFRDRIASYGDSAILALAPWVTDEVLGAFAVRTIEKAGARASRDLAIATLEAVPPSVGSSAIHRDILEAIARIQAHSTTEVRQGAQGATIAGAPKLGEAYAPPLSAGEQELLRVLGARLPAGWTIFVRPHLDGDRPSLALLHRERGAMLWDVRQIDISRLAGSPRGYRDEDGVPFLDPIERINAVRRRLYREYLPAWAEAIDDKPARFGVVRVGIFFPSGELRDLQRLGLSDRPEVVIGQGGLESALVDALVPNAFRSVEMNDEWFDTLYRRFSEYHPPTFGRIRPSRRQQELIDDVPAPGWRGVEGVAGSGKTLVLARRATKLARERRRVLLVTYNLTLANYCRALVEDAPDRFNRSDLTVQHFHGLCHAILRGLDLPPPIHPAGRDDDPDAPPVSPELLEEQERDHYESRWPTAVRRALANSEVPSRFSFDTILIDEAQDFSPAFFDVLSDLQPNGAFLVAFDRAQRLYARVDGLAARMDMRFVKKLNATRRLRRRHADIATALGVSRRLATERIELDDDSPALLAEGEARWVTVADTASAIAAARRLLETWREADGYHTDGTVLLVPSASIGRAVVALLAEGDIDSNHIFPSEEAEKRPRKLAFAPRDQRVKVATIHSFKGWEADDVVVIEPPSGGLRSAAALYVALTRSKSRLAVIASSDPYDLKRHFDVTADEADGQLRSRASELLAKFPGPRPRTSDEDD